MVNDVKEPSSLWMICKNETKATDEEGKEGETRKLKMSNKFRRDKLYYADHIYYKYKIYNIFHI